ncbi:MAG TPA: Imm52 family immunity protein [Pseudonocardiaceae bacterium]|nr:Imm52 family immunity protein [Pseudonocardiaceae bacterium]
MTRDTWEFRAGWAARPDDLANCAERMAASLTYVASLDPLLTQWLYDSEPVPVDESSLRRRLDTNWDRETPSGAHGSHVSLRNGQRDDLTVATFSVSCGATASCWRNRVALMPPRPVAAPALYRLDSMLGLFDSMISIWRPRWCRMQPQSLREVTYHGTVDVLASWIAYLDRDLYPRIGALPDGISKIERADGDIFVLASTAAEVELSTIDRLREHITFPDEDRRLG